MQYIGNNKLGGGGGVKFKCENKEKCSDKIMKAVRLCIESHISLLLMFDTLHE